MCFCKDRLFAVILALISLVALVITRLFPREAAYYPRTIIFLLIGLSVWLYAKADKDNVVDLRKVFKDFFTQRSLLYVSLALVILISLMQPIGFYLILPLFTSYVMWVLGYRKPVRVVLISLILTIVVYLVFSLMLHVQVPMGLLKR